jgi:hypothetical protein
MKTIAAFIIGLLIATAWAQIDNVHGIVWLPAHGGALMDVAIKWACATMASWCGVDPRTAEPSTNPLSINSNG